MNERNCGNCRFFRPSALVQPGTDGLCDFQLPDFLKKYDDETALRQMSAEKDWCSFHRKKKVR